MKEIDNTFLKAKRIANTQVFWRLWCRFYPLAMTDFAMALGDMLRPIALSRLPGTEVSLAAIGVIKSIAVFLESPIIMILQASTALSINKASHRSLWRFTLMAAGVLTSIFLVSCYEPIYEWLFIDLFGVSLEIAMAARFSFFMMIPWPALIAIRRFYQGLLVRDRQEKSMAMAGAMRLFFTIGLLWAGTLLELNGTMVAALSLIVAVAIEAFMVVYLHHKNTKKDHPFSDNNQSLLPQNVTEVALYYAPLGATSMIVWGARALMLGVIARAPSGVLGIAIWTVAMGFVLPVANATRMVQQIAISSMEISREILVKFTLLIGIGCTLPLLLFGFTDSGSFLLDALLGDNQNISIASILILKICIFLPLLTALQNTYQGFLILAGGHWWINAATIINMMVSLLLAMLLIIFKFSGETSAAIATVLGLFLEVGILMIRYQKLK
jgi:Na+-driven multidrug efflux pump